MVLTTVSQEVHALTIKPNTPLKVKEMEVYKQIMIKNYDTTKPLVKYWMDAGKVSSSKLTFDDVGQLVIEHVKKHNPSKKVTISAAKRASLGYVLCSLAALGVTGEIEKETGLDFIGHEELQTIYQSYEILEWLCS